VGAVLAVVAVVGTILDLRRDARTRVDSARSVESGSAEGVAWSGLRVGPEVQLTPVEPGAGEHPCLRDVRAIVAGDGGAWLATTGGLVAVGPDGGDRRIYTARSGLLRNDVAGLAVEGEVLAAVHPEEGITLIRGDRVRSLSHPDLVPTSVTAGAGGFHVGTADRGLLWLAGETLYTVEIAGETESGPWALEAPRVTALAVDPGTGDLWVGTFDRGVAVRREGEWELLGTTDGLADLFVTSLAVERTSDATRVLVGTQTGLTLFEAGRTRILGRVEGLPDDHVAAVAASEGRMAVGTYGGGLGLYEGEGWSTAGRPDLPSDYVQAVTFDGRGGLWIGTRAGAVRRGMEGWTPVELPPGPPGPRITALLSDPGPGAGAVWAGTFDNGLGRWSEESWTTLGEDDGLPSREINALALHRDTLWVGTNAGAAYFADPGFHEHPRLAALDGIAVTALTSDGEALWLGTSRGVYRLSASGQVSHLGVRDGLVNGHVYALARHGDRMWIGTLGGLSGVPADGTRDPAGTLTVHSGPGGLAHAWVNALVTGPERLHAGTYGGGVDLLRGQGWEHLFPDAGETLEVNPGAGVRLGETVLFGTLDRGVLVLPDKGAGGRLLREDLGLPSPSVTALHLAGDQLWIGTAAGLVTVDPSTVR